jgi:hypothetical protein
MRDGAIGGGGARAIALVSTFAMLALLVLPARAAACVCREATIEARLDAADVAFVGRIASEEDGVLRGQPVRLLTVAVEQRVKGDVPETLVVRSPRDSDCDLVVPGNRSVGLLLTKAPTGAWLGSACSIADPGQLVAAGGEPRGGAIKVVVGIVVLGLVLLLAFVRLRRGSRPSLPGSPTG